MIDILDEGASWRVYWYDQQQTILIGEITAKWTWVESYEATESLSRIIRGASPEMITTILWFTTPVTRVVPRNTNFTLLYQFLKVSIPNEDLYVFVNAPKLLELILMAVIRTYKMTGLTSLYRYVDTFENAIELIEEHRKATDRTTEHNSP